MIVINLSNIWFSLFCFFKNLQQDIEQIESSYTIGPIEMMTENLKTSLTTEAKAWEYSYAKALNEISAQKMNTVFSFFDRMMKSLSHPVKDLDDVRSLMAAIKEGKETEVSVELNFIPIEEAYSLLHKYGIVFNDGNAERLDSFAYLFSKVKTQVRHFLEQNIICYLCNIGCFINGIISHYIKHN